MKSKGTGDDKNARECLHDPEIEVREEVLKGISAAYKVAMDSGLQLGLNWFIDVARMTEQYLRDHEAKSEVSEP